ncbi:MAG: alpha/beta fold hydrolase [Actinomycetes bacterium]
MRQSVLLHSHEVAYVDHAGAGIPLLLVHGVGSSLETWGDVPDRLAATGFRVIAVDLIGHGESGLGNGDFSLGANASVIRDLLDHLGVGRVHLVGHSLGGGVSMQFLYQFPDRVETLTLVSSGGLGPDVAATLRAATLPGSRMVIRLASRPGFVSTASWLGRALNAFGKDVDALSPRAMSRLSALSDDGRSAAFLATLRSVVGPAGQTVYAMNKLQSVDPERVLVIWGAEDPTLPVQHAWDTHEQLPGSRIVIVPGAHHHPHTDNPDLFVRALVQHVGLPVAH